MTFLPIVARELRVAARRHGTFWTRAAVALGAIGMGIFLYLANIDAPAAFLSRRIFSGLIALAVFFCLVAGRRSTADCLSREKREGTLGLLFLTDLKGYDIVLGKLAATSLSGFYGLLAAFPVLAVPMLMGGITNGEFWRVVLVLADTFLFSLAVGMFVSSLSRDARRAMGANLLLLLLLIASPGALAALVAYLGPAHVVYWPLMFSCPLYSLFLCEDPRYKAQASDYWWSVAVLHGLTWLLLALSSWAVRRSWQDKPETPARVSWRQLWRHWRYGPAASRPLYRRRLLNVNAFYWLAARSRFKPLQVWGVLLFIALWWIGASLSFGTLWLDESTSGTNLTAAIMLNLALKLWIGLEACRPLAEERRAGALELLLSTPLTVQDVLQGQWLALKRQFLFPAIAGLVTVLGFMVTSLRHSPENHPLLLLGWLGAIVLFCADTAALVWAAMYCALTTHSPNQAIVVSISRVIIAPAVLFGAVAVLTNVSRSTVGASAPPSWFYLSCWLGFGIIADLAYGITARRRLLTRFRTLAGEDRARKIKG